MANEELLCCRPSPSGFRTPGADWSSYCIADAILMIILYSLHTIYITNIMLGLLLFKYD